MATARAVKKPVLQKPVASFNLRSHRGLTPTVVSKAASVTGEKTPKRNKTLNRSAAPSTLVREVRCLAPAWASLPDPSVTYSLK